jgi:hypothetical protein
MREAAEPASTGGRWPSNGSQAVGAQALSLLTRELGPRCMMRACPYLEKKWSTEGLLRLWRRRAKRAPTGGGRETASAKRGPWSTGCEAFPLASSKGVF